MVAGAERPEELVVGDTLHLRLRCHVHGLPVATRSGTSAGPCVDLRARLDHHRLVRRQLVALRVARAAARRSRWPSRGRPPARPSRPAPPAACRRETTPSASVTRSGRTVPADDLGVVLRLAPDEVVDVEPERLPSSMQQDAQRRARSLLLDQRLLGHRDAADRAVAHVRVVEVVVGAEHADHPGPRVGGRRGRLVGRRAGRRRAAPTRTAGRVGRRSGGASPGGGAIDGAGLGGAAGMGAAGVAIGAGGAGGAAGAGGAGGAIGGSVCTIGGGGSGGAT